MSSIKSLRLKNFLLFDQLTIESLLQFNLVVGKNGAGKTALLDAIRLEVADQFELVLNDILDDRGYKYGHSDQALRSLLTQEKKYPIIINEISIVEDEIGFAYIFPSKNNEKLLEKRLRAQESSKRYDTAVYIPSKRDLTNMVRFWDEIALTSKEDDVLKLLQNIINPNIVRVSVLDGQVKVRLSNYDKPVPIGSLGDGVSRLFLIALGLVNAQDGLLLIDELETHLHYSVYSDLWRIFLQYGKKWNIQMVITTHSDNLVSQFSDALAREGLNDDGQLIRLQRSREGKIEAITYPASELEKLVELDLELR